MENAGYVVTGWVLTGIVLLAYTLDIARRTRRATRPLAASRVISPSQGRFSYARRPDPDR